MNKFIILSLVWGGIVVLGTIIAGCSSKDNQGPPSSFSVKRPDTTNSSQAQVLDISKPNELEKWFILGQQSKKPNIKVFYEYDMYREAMFVPYDPVPKKICDRADQAAAWLSGNTEAVVCLAPILRHHNGYYRWTAAAVMGQFGAEPCIPFLKNALKTEKDDYVREHIETAIAKIYKRKKCK